MTVKKRGLGRGLSDLGLNELLSRMSTEVKVVDTPSSEADKHPELKNLDLDAIQPGKYQPRRDIDEKSLQELAESIQSQGIIQPIVVRKIAAKRYEIIAGERRWRAAKIAGLKEIPVIVRDIPDEAAIAMALIENIQREDLNAIEEAIALQRLSQEFSLTHQEIATIVGKSRATISNLLRLLTLPSEIKLMVEKGEIEMGHARALLSLDEERQLQVAKQINLKKLSVRETELYIRRLLNLSDIPIPVEKDVNLARIEKTLAKHLGLRVTIKAKDENKGKLIVHYKNSDQLHSILEHFEE
ncbi:MAG: ParB/RepB/Spo0J family partition protein [Gammaproteobacteria bacterium]|nr:ParB/RepB/Spo0J family partition protein [Gammaproteobacteria bacterium]